MKKSIFILYAVIMMCSIVCAQQDTTLIRNIADNWVATDALGRELPCYAEVGPRRNDKFIGMFYYIWQGAHGNQVYDISKILVQKPENRKWGPNLSYHFWGEPEYGYFRAGDPFVIRHDLQMLSNADIDFIFFDVTNAVTYLDVVNKICEVSLEMRKMGTKTPQICFATNSQSGRTMNELYDKFYAQEKYRTLWFYWDGKPLIMGNSKDPELRKDVEDFFTIKYSWAWSDSANYPNHWQWLDHYPQDYGWSISKDIPEQITVSTAQHPTTSIGKSFHYGKQPKVNELYVSEYTDRGLYFEEQWKQAHKIDPKVVMVTQWNEWVAMRFISDGKNQSDIYAARKAPVGTSFFVDVFSPEFNRDIAPMKGGYGDNYYYQLISHVRRFKGLDSGEEYSNLKDIIIDGSFTDWNEITPVFRDHKGDVMHRDYPGYNPNDRYINKTGRNDIIESRVSYNEDKVFFYVKTTSTLTPHTGKNWMLLFIDVDKDKKTGWEGYDYIINLDVISDTVTTLKKWNNEKWVTVKQIDYAYSHDELELAVDKSVFDSQKMQPSFRFHWADNIQQMKDVSAFSLDGDSAPDRRFDYEY